MSSGGIISRNCAGSIDGEADMRKTVRDKCIQYPTRREILLMLPFALCYAFFIVLGECGKTCTLDHYCLGHFAAVWIFTGKWQHFGGGFACGAGANCHIACGRSEGFKKAFRKGRQAAGTLVDMAFLFSAVSAVLSALFSDVLSYLV